MSRWTHNICGACWTELYGYEPIRLRNAKEEKCCFCGHPTTEGIYVRHNPMELECKGIHKEGDER